MLPQRKQPPLMKQLRLSGEMMMDAEALRLKDSKAEG
jgi:hypothetical protein